MFSFRCRQDEDKGQIQNRVLRIPEGRIGKRVFIQQIYHHTAESRTGALHPVVGETGENLVPESESQGKEAEAKTRGGNICSSELDGHE